MKTRQLGKNGPFLSEIGLGAWAIGGPWAYGWGKQSDAASIKTIRKALDTGVNWVDTAAVYGLGRGEKVVGEAIKDRRKTVFVATKCGLVWDDRKRVRNNNHPESIRNECENSLRRLQIDEIDLYQIHWPDKNVPVEDSWGEMTRLREEGKVRYIGVSNFDVPLLERCQQMEPVQSLQPPYSMVNRAVESELLPWCEKNAVGVIAYSPLQNGLLTGKFSKDYLQTLADDDWRKRQKHPFFREERFQKVLAFVDAVRPIAEAYEKTPAQLAIAWVLKHPAVTAAIVGARTETQAAQNAGGAGWQIDAKDLQKIDAYFKKFLGEDPPA